MATDDLRRLGVNEILVLNPSYGQLRGMRDGLIKLRK